MGAITMNEKELLRLEAFNKLSVRTLSQSNVDKLLSISKSQGAKGLESKKKRKKE